MKEGQVFIYCGLFFALCILSIQNDHFCDIDFIIFHILNVVYSCFLKFPMSHIQPLAYGYAKDPWSVYFAGRKVEGASATSFEVLNDGYAKDPWSIYFAGRKIEGASATTFNVLGDGYAKDPWNVYYMGQKLEGATATSFQTLGQGMAKDAFNHYYMGQKSNGFGPSIHMFH